MKTVWVRLKDRSYPIYIGRGLLRRLPALLLKHGLKGRAAVVTDVHLRRDFAEPLQRGLRAAGWESSLKALPRGERAKSFAELVGLYGFLLKTGAERRTPLIAVGGGTVGDAAGFAAATYYRGIPLVHVPTTLLAQVDSAIGGKTAVNHPLAKNAVGAFHQPAFVLADVGALKGLPRRALLSGLAEVVKYGLVFDPPFARWLDRSWGRLLAGEPAALLRVVEVSARWKAEVVSADERDSGGRREFLNFGHTVGHALESAAGYGFFTHGEAVAWGMGVALALSEGRGWLKYEESRLTLALLGRLAKPAPPPRLRWSAVLSAMSHDKKARAGHSVFILLRGLGRPVQADDVTRAELAAAAARAGLSLSGGIR